MKTACCCALTALLICTGCGSGGGAIAPLDVVITSPQEREAVSGVFTLAGAAVGGSVEVAVDAEPFVAVDGTETWSIEIDTSEWFDGWHTVQARVRRGTEQALARVNLYCGSGYMPPPPPTGPPPAPPPPEEPIDGLVAHYEFLDGGALDSSGNRYHGTRYGGPRKAAGIVDDALSFDGHDDLVMVPDDSNAPPAAVGDLAAGTIAVWFRYDGLVNGTAPAEIMPIFYFGSDEASTDANGYDCVEIYIAHGDLFMAERRMIYFTVLKGTTVVLCFDSTVVLEQGVWYHYAVTIDQAGHKAYLDGEELELHYNAGTGPSSYAFFTTVNDRDMLTIGYGLFGVSFNWWYFLGLIDDLRIYDRVLTASEIGKLASP